MTHLNVKRLISSVFSSTQLIHLKCNNQSNNSETSVGETKNKREKENKKTFSRPALRVFQINSYCLRYLLSIKYRTEEHAHRATELSRKAAFSSLKLWALILEKRELINLLKGMSKL